MGLSPGEIVLLGVGALLVGFAKTAIGGVAAITVAIFASVLPAKESTGALLPLLMVGDVLAVAMYRRHADWSALLRLFPAVAAGVVVGTLFVSRVDDVVMRRTIASVLLLLVAVHLWQKRRGRTGGTPSAPAGPPRSRFGGTAQHVPALAYGLLAGFTTMVANAGGSVMSIYLLSAGLGVLGFLGTAAWFFMVVNAFKVPFSVGLGLITGESLLLCLVLAPAVVAGALVGRQVIKRLDAGRFEALILVFTVASSLNLLR
jgi:uncharacterized protein